MTDTNYSLSSPGDSDDLPRTLRRERERQKAERQGMSMGGPTGISSSAASGYHAGMTDDLVQAAVKRFEVPFLHLMMFYIKAVLAAIPALILLGALLWLGGYALKVYFPWLVQAEFIIRLPK